MCLWCAGGEGSSGRSPVAAQHVEAPALSQPPQLRASDADRRSIAVAKKAGALKQNSLEPQRI
jgi:hypothetical protein